MAAVAKTLSLTERASKYSMSTANGFGGEGEVQMCTSSAMTSQTLASAQQMETCDRQWFELEIAHFTCFLPV